MRPRSRPSISASPPSLASALLAFGSLQTVDASKSTGDLSLDVSVFPNVKSVTMGEGNDYLVDALSFKAATVTTVTYGD